jgi:YtcA family
LPCFVTIWPVENIVKHHQFGIGLALATAAALVLTACDPVINIAGANFPAWLLCAIIGGAGVAVVRAAMLATGLDPYLWWRPGFYASSAALIASAVWIAFFNRT